MLTKSASADTALGLPYNIASYALLTHMVAQVTGMGVDKFIWQGGDCHIYSNQWDGVNEQLTRTPTKLPRLEFTREVNDINEFKYEDFKVVDYNPQPAIVYPRAAV